MTHSESQVDVHDAIKALAFIGDLSMGQPIDHSTRAAWIAAELAAAMGFDDDIRRNSRLVALLRWSGCTANAPDFSDLMGDDVDGRRAMLSTSARSLPASVLASMGSLVQIHCEVSGDVARTLGLPARVELALRNIFASPDGGVSVSSNDSGGVPVEVFLVAVAGDLEIFNRVYGIERAVDFIEAKAATRYPADIATMLIQHAADWLHSLDKGAHLEVLPAPPGANLQETPLELIADVIDLKLPWLTGYSRRVATTARACAAAIGCGTGQQHQIYRAGLIHGIGRASVPNAVWEDSGVANEGAAELLRLVPYWTSRSVRRIGSLKAEAEIASFVDERLDGSGFFRGVSGDAISQEGQVLAAAAHWVLLQTDRPGRPALDKAQANAQMLGECEQGRFAKDIVASLTGQVDAASHHDTPVNNAESLTSREIEVLNRISLGESNKEAARSLGISPSTVRAHLENVFRKLECTTRAAATLKAMHRGLFRNAVSG